MRRISILLSMLPVGLMAQNFTEIQTSMNNFYYSAADIADIDNNGTMDIVLNGAIDSDGDGNVDIVLIIKYIRIMERHCCLMQDWELTLTIWGILSSLIIIMTG
jgi:hypothetical protein